MLRPLEEEETDPPEEVEMRDLELAPNPPRLWLLYMPPPREEERTEREELREYMSSGGDQEEIKRRSRRVRSERQPQYL